MVQHISGSRQYNKHLIVQPVLSLGAICGIIAITWFLKSLNSSTGDIFAVTIVLGTIIGVIFQKSRFCIFCMFRDLIENRNARPFLGLAAAIAAGSAGYLIIFESWVPSPSGDWLPPNAFITPAGLNLAAGGLIFGFGMAISGSCISSHIYRLGSGNLTSAIALAAAVPGFILGYLTWDFWYLNFIQNAPVLWLPEMAGYAGGTIIHFLILGTVVLIALKIHKPAAGAWIQSTSGGPKGTLLGWVKNPWNIIPSGAALGIIGAAAYFRVRPLGVTSEFSRISREIAEGTGILGDGRLPGIDSLAGCTPQEAAALITQNGALLLAIGAGSFTAALASGKFKLQGIELSGIGRHITGGMLLGYGSMIALGCSIGAFLSGVMALSVSGWIFGISMTAGIAAGLAVNKRTNTQTGCSIPSAPPSVYRSPAAGQARNSNREYPVWEQGFSTVTETAPEILKSTGRYIVLDAGRSESLFEAGHIPGAVWFDINLVSQKRRGVKGMFPESFDSLPLFDSSSTVLIYDGSGGKHACRTALALAFAGNKKISVLNGGIEAWIIEGYPLEKGASIHHSHPSRKSSVNRNPGIAGEPEHLKEMKEIPSLPVLITAEELKNNLENYTIIDNRSPEEYTGKRIRARRGGHIPGAVHLDWREAHDSRGLTKEPGAIYSLWRDHLSREKETVLYCHSGLRSSHAAWSIIHAGLTMRLRLYDGSWEEWGNRDDLPAAEGT